VSAVTVRVMMRCDSSSFKRFASILSLRFGTATAMSQKRVAPFNIERTTMPVHRRPMSSIAW